MLKLEEIRPALGALLTHGVLLVKLAQVEWAAEKLRLARVLVFGVLATVMTITLLLSVSILALVLVWDTQYRWAVALGLVVLYAIGLWLTMRRLRQLFSVKEHSFAGTCEELTADFALLKQKLLL